MLRVALTGGIATGKSYVRARMAAHGVPSIDADAVVHALLASGSAAAGEVGHRFGRQVLRADGAVDRKALGVIVFGDERARRDLEAIIHPRVYEAITAWAAAREREAARWVVADIPLLFETGRESGFDRVVVAACQPEEQVRRVMRRNGLDEAAARARLAAQWPIAAKVARATDVIDTGQSFADTDRQVDALCAEIDGLSPSPDP